MTPTLDKKPRHTHLLGWALFLIAAIVLVVIFIRDGMENARTAPQRRADAYAAQNAYWEKHRKCSKHFEVVTKNADGTVQSVQQEERTVPCPPMENKQPEDTGMPWFYWAFMIVGLVLSIFERRRFI